VIDAMAALLIGRASREIANFLVSAMT